jgi:HEAT repeat protein
MVSALITGASDEARNKVMNHVMHLSPVEDQLVAGRYARLLRSLGRESWSDDQVAVLAARPDGDNFELTRAIERLRAENDDAFRSSLVDRVAAGDLAALHSYGNVTDLPSEASAGMIGHLAAKVAEQTESARSGAYGIGGNDFLHALVLLNVWHPEHANWEPCLEALAESQSIAEHIARAIGLLGAVADRLPIDLRERLKEPLQAIADRQNDPHESFVLFVSSADARGEAVLALAQLFPELVTDAEMRKLVRGEPEQRAAAVQIIIAREDVTQLGLLAAFSKDPEVEVRAAVAYGLADWVARGVGTPGSTEVLSDLLREPGVKLGIYVSRALGEGSTDGGVDALVDQLRLHPSAIVRARVASAQSHG